MGGRRGRRRFPLAELFCFQYRRSAEIGRMSPFVASSGLHRGPPGYTFSNPNDRSKRGSPTGARGRFRIRDQNA